MYKTADNAVILDNKANADVSICAGQSVKVLLQNGSVSLFKICVDTNHAAPQGGIISSESPLGHALIGRKVGDEVEYRVGERILKVKVLGVE